MKNRADAGSATRSAEWQFWVLAVFIGVLWVAGGSVRADALGQFIVRIAAWGMVIAAVLIPRPWPATSPKPVATFLAAATIAVALQLIPLPPGIWTALPGRSILAASVEAAALTQPWRPLSISPGATVNAIGSLVVAVATLLFAARLSRRQHERLFTVVLWAVLGGCVIGLLQLSGSRFDNPFINEARGLTSGNLANRNHFALFVAIGMLLTLVWGLRSDGRAIWKLPMMLTVLPLLALMIFATGSRTGIVLMLVALCGGLLIVRHDLSTAVKGLSRRRIAAFAGIFVATVGVVALVAIRFGRSEAIDRLSLDAGGDMRLQALPTVLRMVGTYFPWGGGFGTFDPAFRIIEPDSLLRTVYFNHAHNDWLEIISDGGVIAAALAIFAVVWWARRSIAAWRPERMGGGGHVAQVGSMTMLLIMIASITDYPARTPLIMALLVLSAVWLAIGQRSLTSSRGGRRVDPSVGFTSTAARPIES